MIFNHFNRKLFFNTLFYIRCTKEYSPQRIRYVFFLQGSVSIFAPALKRGCYTTIFVSPSVFRFRKIRPNVSSIVTLQLLMMTIVDVFRKHHEKRQISLCRSHKFQNDKQSLEQAGQCDKISLSLTYKKALGFFSLCGYLLTFRQYYLMHES